MTPPVPQNNKHSKKKHSLANEIAEKSEEKAQGAITAILNKQNAHQGQIQSFSRSKCGVFLRVFFTPGEKEKKALLKDRI